MRDFAEIRREAASRKGGEAALDALLTQPLSAAEIMATPGDRFLSAMTKCVFQAGFNWQLIENKWSDFESAFEGFDLYRAAMMSDEDIERLMSNREIVRNGPKIRSVGSNARFLLSLGDGDASRVGTHFAGWNPGAYCASLRDLQKGASRMGGRTAQIFLRRVGVDSLVFSPDVLRALEREGVVAKMPSSKGDYAAVQAAIDRWSAETGYGLNAISQTLAFSIA